MPAVALVSSGFAPQARYQAGRLGYSNLAFLFVPHPISDQTPAELYAKADAVFPAVRACLEHAPGTAAQVGPHQVSSPNTSFDASCST